MFRTGIISDEVSQNLQTAIALARAYHLDTLEIRSVNEKNPFEMSLDDFRSIRSQADDAGLQISCVGSPFFKCDINNPKEISDHMEGLLRCMQGAHILGTKLIRGFSFWYQENTDYDQIASLYQPVIGLAQQEDIVLVLESEPSVNTRNMAQLARLLSAIDHPRVRALFDPGNEICDHDAPAPYPEGYNRLKPYIAHIHIKDMRRTKTGFEPSRIGDGMVDFYSIFAAIARDGYQGDATLETHWRVLNKIDETLMTRPQGSGFSYGGEEASRICLDVLRDQYGYGRN